MKFYPLLLISFILLISACSTTEKQVEKDDPSVESEQEPGDINDDKSAAFAELLETSRSKLSDSYSTRSHDMPEAFLEEIEFKEKEKDIYAGYRVQILSTRDITLADSVQSNFRVWADTTFSDYVPRSYIFFHQPYYRVHVGDFSDRSRAIELSRYLKRRYPDAWVVHDRIEPEQVPADTVKIGANR